jgi:hypothetical protein
MTSRRVATLDLATRDWVDRLRAARDRVVVTDLARLCPGNA